MSYSFIREKLAKNVIVNGDSIVQPLATENLSGMFALLHQEYNKITMGAFCDYLMALMSESSSKEESSKNPQVQLKRMDKHLKMWLDMDLEKFMTPDHLFTICLLRSYHPDTVIRSDGVRHILEYSRRLETDITLKAAVGEYANMPLYTELVRWINDVHVKSMQFSNSAKGSPANTMPNAPHTSQSDKKSPSLELAATATSATGASATAASENTNGPRRNQRPYFHPRNKTYASGPYHAEVYRTSDLYGKSGFPYQALTNPCVSCNHIPRCLGKQCPKCHYWGHNATDCCQVVRKPDAGDAGQRWLSDGGSCDPSRDQLAQATPIPSPIEPSPDTTKTVNGELNAAKQCETTFFTPTAAAVAAVGDVALSLTENEDDIDNKEYVMSVLSDNSIEKFDSGASRSMSGNPNHFMSIQ